MYCRDNSTSGNFDCKYQLVKRERVLIKSLQLEKVLSGIAWHVQAFLLPFTHDVARAVLATSEAQLKRTVHLLSPTEHVKEIGIHPFKFQIEYRDMATSKEHKCPQKGTEMFHPWKPFLLSCANESRSKRKNPPEILLLASHSFHLVRSTTGAKKVQQDSF